MTGFEYAGPPPPICGATRGPRSVVVCEMPPGHPDRAEVEQITAFRFHAGRGEAGRWYSWPAGTGLSVSGDTVGTDPESTGEPDQGEPR